MHLPEYAEHGVQFTNYNSSERDPGTWQTVTEWSGVHAVDVVIAIDYKYWVDTSTIQFSFVYEVLLRNELRTSWPDHLSRETSCIDLCVQKFMDMQAQDVSAGP
jgi:hypothetical protein